MCIILFAYRAHSLYRLILAANRDEYYARPTARAAFWEDAPEILGGRDLEHGGTWLGVTTGGRLAAVTNFRDPSELKRGAPSRGHLVSDFLRSRTPAAEHLAGIAQTSSSYNGFNLIAGDATNLYYHSNRGASVQSLAPGVYGLSNHLLDTAWPKVETGKRRLSQVIEQGVEILSEDLFDILADRREAEEQLLPQTGISTEWERALSPVFIKTEAYGTRSSTLLLIDFEDRITFSERTFHPGALRAEDAVFRFESTRSDKL